MTTTNADAGATVRTRHFHAGLGGAKITVKSPFGQKTYPLDHSAVDAHAAAVEQYATDVMGLLIIHELALDDFGDGWHRKYRVRGDHTDYSRDSDERHPDNCANCAGDLEDHDTEQLQTCIREHLTALGV